MPRTLGRKKTYQNKTLEKKSLFDLLTKRIPLEYLTNEYFKKIEGTFKFIDAMQIESLFEELQKKNLAA
jgi:hypothetical protein